MKDMTTGTARIMNRTKSLAWYINNHARLLHSVTTLNIRYQGREKSVRQQYSIPSPSLSSQIKDSVQAFGRTVSNRVSYPDQRIQYPV